MHFSDCDNKDGIKPGVQAEIDIVQKQNIKALYYFCDENSSEKTALEQSLMGAHNAKSKTVHTFNDLSIDSARALINDIVTVYHYYCTCKDYILKFTTGQSYPKFPDKIEKSSEMDDWRAQFLPVLFEGRSVKHFNTGIFLESIKAQQTDEFYHIVQIRWQAIQDYSLGNIEKCIRHLDAALKYAKETNQHG